MKAKQREKGKPAAPARRCKWHEMNRKQRREMMRKLQSEDLSMEVIHPDAAGIDIGNEFHYVAVPQKRDSEPVRRFGCTTAERNRVSRNDRLVTGNFPVDQSLHNFVALHVKSALGIGLRHATRQLPV